MKLLHRLSLQYFFVLFSFTNLIIVNETLGQCNPDNPNAPPFCAPSPVCSNGNLLWTQSINSTDGSAAVRLYCGSTTTYTIPGPYPSSFSSGELLISIDDAVSYDGYTGRNTVTQPNERWRLIFKKNGATVATSNYSGDVPDQVTQGYWRGSLGSVYVPNGVDQITIEHWSVAQDCNSPNSVVPTSVCISAVPYTCSSTPPSLCDANISSAYSVLSPGAFCTPDAWTADQHTFSLNAGPNPGAYQIKSGTTPRIIEYADGTFKGLIEVSYSLGTVGSMDNSRGYIIELTGSQRTTGSPVAPWSPATGCGISNQSSWIYYNIFTMKVCGTGSNASHKFTVSGPAQAYSHSFQIGNGANTWNSSLGGGIWFTQANGGDLQFRLTPVTTSGITVSAGANSTICYGASKTITASASGGTSPYTYVWNNGLGSGASKTVSPTSTTTYRVTATDASGCTGTSQVTVNVNPQINFTIVNDALCSGSGTYTKTVQATGGTSPYTYTWSGGLGTGSSKNLPISNATYTVTVADNIGCTASASFTVTVNSISASASNNGPLTCSTTSVTLTANPATGVTYAWSGGGTSRTKTVTAAGTYTVTVTSLSNGCTAVATTTVTSDTSVPAASATNNGPLSCSTSSVTLTANPATGVTYLWSNGGQTTRTKTVTTAGTYTVTVTNNSNGCTAVATTTVTGDTSVPLASATNNGPLSCSTSSVTLTANPATGVTYLWSNGGQTTQTKTVTTAGTYTVTVTNNSNGCTAVATTTVTGDTSVPSASATNDGPLTCITTSVTLTANPATGVTYLWSNGGQTTRTKTVSAPGTYTVTITNNSNGCTAVTTTTVTQDITPPSASATNNGPLTCSTTSVTMTANPATGVTYLWSNGGQTTRTKTVSAPGTYTVTVTNNSNGCTAVTNTTVTQDITPPSASATNNGPLTCSTTSVTMTANPATGVTYLWSNGGQTTRTKTVSAPGTYTVTVTNNSNGCTAVTTTTVTQDITPPSASATNNGPLTCSTTSVTMTANPATGVTYLWSNGGQTTRTKTVSAPGTYTVTVTNNSNGCTAVATTTVAGDTSVPSASATNNGPLTCSTTSVTLTANPASGVTYLWSNGGQTTRTKSVSAPGTYTVTVTNESNGCTAVTSTTVIENNTIPAASATNNGPLTCIVPNVTMTANPASGVTYLWSNGGQTTRTKSVSVPGTYTVTVTNNSNGCTAVTTTTVTQDITPPSASASNDGPLTCSNTSVTMTANPASGVTYLWSNGGQTTRTKTVSVPNTYTVTVTNLSNGCTSTASTIVTQDNTSPTATADNIGGPLTCIDNAVTIRAFPNVATYTYSWSGPSGYSATSRTNVVSTPGVYQVTVTDTGNGCTGMSSTTVLQDITPPVASATNNGPLTCIRTSVTLTANPASGVTYAWSGGGTTRTKTVTVPGTYVVTVTNDSNGCTSTASTVVTQDNTPPTATADNIGGPLTCVDNAVTIRAFPDVAGMTYSWSGPNGYTSASRTNVVSAPGSYGVTVTNSTNGCTGAAVTVVSQNITPPTVTADNIGGPLTCIDNAVTIRALPNISTYTYTWSGPNGYTSTAINNTVSVSGNYSVTVTDTDNGCTASSQTTVLQDTSIPTVNAGPDKTICAGTSSTLTATGSGTYVWSYNNATTASITVTPSGTTTYTVTVTGSNGCTASDAAIVNVTPLPVSGITGPDEICVDEYALFTASPAVSGATYAWLFDGGTSADGDANDPSESIKWGVAYQNTTRTVTLTVSKDNCSTTYTKPIFVKNGVYLNTQDNYPVCQGGTVQIGPNPSDPNAVPPGANFTWTPNLYLNSNTVAQPLSTPPFDITYTLTATLSGCAVSRQITVDVDVNLNPVADAGQDKTVCEGQSVQIGGNPTATPPVGATILGVDWTPLSGAAKYQTNPMVSPTTNTQYRVVVIASTGCTDTDFVNVVVQPKALIGDYVWQDNNGNGVQDAGEPGLQGVSVKMYNTSNVLVDETVTDATGHYQFMVCSGTYYIEFGTYPGYSRTISNTPDDAKDSDANVTTGKTQNYTLNPGDNNPTVDAGYVPNGKIGDYVWQDTNGNGLQDGGEPGVSGVTVELLNSSGQVIATTVTDSQGMYEFTNLPPGTYYVHVVVPPGYNVTTPNSGNDNSDSDISSTTYTTGSITLTPGQENLTVDAGLIRPASLGDYVWEDKNGNGVQDAGETPISGVVVMLQDAAGNPALDINGNIVASTTTNASGYYQFTNLKPGVVYVVKFTTPSGYTPTVANTPDDTKDSDANVTTGKSTGVTLTSGENNTTVDAGYYKLGSIGDLVWDDRNGNGIQDPGEPGIGGLTVTLTGTAGDGTPVTMTTTTNPDGSYIFNNLKPGDYTVTFTKPSGTVFTTKDGTTDDKDSDANPTTGVTSTITLQSGQNITTVDAGVIRPASLGDYVWNDTNGNGVQDVGETPISGVVVMLQDAAGNPALDINGNVVASTTTNGSGFYQFTNLKPGVVYVVKFTTPSGYAPTVANTPDDTKDSDANVTTGKATGVTLTGGENNTTIDAGYYRPGSIGNYVWNDLNGNGIQDPGEPGISGVTVTLTGTKGDGTPLTPITVTTDGNGYYIFPDLPPGTYTVTFTKPANTVTTTPGQGTEATDSDADPTTGSTSPVTLVSGQNIDYVDAGYLMSASLGNYVWNDINANGVQDAGELPISGVVVMLQDAAGNPARDINNNLVPNQVTDGSGMYLFTNLKPGVGYVVVFVTPSGYTPTVANTPDDTKDSDANVTTGKSQVVTLTSGESNLTVDAGYYQRSALGDYVWEDLNLNGVQDAGEPGIGGVVVRLYNSDGVQVGYTLTSSSGAYSFTNLIPGTYTVKFDKPTNYEPTKKNIGDPTKDSNADLTTGLTASVILAGNETNNTIDAGYYRLGSIGNFVWEDRNGNGVQDAFEPGIPNVTVTLTGTDAFGNPVNLVTTTDSNGAYVFNNLVPGTYTVTFTRPDSTYKSSPAGTGGDPTKDSNANVTTGASGAITLTSGEVNTTIDAGYYRCSQVGDYVWIDANRNGTQDAGEVGVNGITVQLYSQSNPTVVLQSMVTTVNPNDNTKNGYYNFEICTPGNYFIKVLKPDDYLFTQPNLGGGNDNFDSDVVDFLNKTTLVFTVNYAVTITDIDAGIYAIPLPIDLVEFSGRWNERKDVNELYWRTLIEENNDRFEIERRVNGGEFELIGEVKGNGTSKDEHEYGYEDTDIHLNGKYEYRLKQVDYDGRYTYSNVVEIAVERGGTISTDVYPNPSYGDVTIHVNGVSGVKVDINVYDNVGRLVLAHVYNDIMEGSDMKTQISRNDLSNGVYHVRIDVGGVQRSHKLIIIE